MDNLITITKSDLAEAKKVHKLISEFAGSEVDFAGRLQGKTHLIITARHNGELAGYSISYDTFNDGSLYCWMGCVVDSKLRQSVYQVMADYREEFAKKKGGRKLRLKTRNTRRGMLSWLVKQGWFCMSVEEQSEPGENRIVFEKNFHQNLSKPEFIERLLAGLNLSPPHLIKHYPPPLKPEESA